MIHAGRGHWAFLEFCEIHFLLLRALISRHDYLSGLFFVGLRFKNAACDQYKAATLHWQIGKAVGV